MSNFRMWEVFGKALDGPFYRDQNEYIIKRFIPIMRDVIKKYEIKWDRETCRQH